MKEILVSLFNGISTFVDYQMPNLSLYVFTNPFARTGCNTRRIKKFEYDYDHKDTNNTSKNT